MSKEIQSSTEDSLKALASSKAPSLSDSDYLQLGKLLFDQVYYQSLLQKSMQNLDSTLKTMLDSKALEVPVQAGPFLVPDEEEIASQGSLTR